MHLLIHVRRVWDRVPTHMCPLWMCFTWGMKLYPRDIFWAPVLWGGTVYPTYT